MPGALGRQGRPGTPGPRGPPGIPRLINSVENCTAATEGLMKYNKQLKAVQYCDGAGWLSLSPSIKGTATNPAASCKEVATHSKSGSDSGQYWIRPSLSEPPFQTYCDLKEGWTLIMKIDGQKQTFAYNSPLWYTMNENSLSLDDNEAKFASYWTLPFTELRLGMKMAGTTRWITISYSASSLYSLIADGQYRSTSVGESSWRSLLPRSSLQNNCNKEGFNSEGLHPKYIGKTAQARLGFIANEQNDCDTPDSFIRLSTMVRSQTASGTLRTATRTTVM